MAKKGRKSRLVQPKKEDDNVIRIAAEDLPKKRGVMPPPGRRHHNRTRDVARGRRRNPKHKGKREN